jgi:hypothetical protein
MIWLHQFVYSTDLKYSLALLQEPTVHRLMAMFFDPITQLPNYGMKGVTELLWSAKHIDTRSTFGTKHTMGSCSILVGSNWNDEKGSSSIPQASSHRSVSDWALARATRDSCMMTDGVQVVDVLASIKTLFAGSPMSTVKGVMTTWCDSNPPQILSETMNQDHEPDYTTINSCTWNFFQRVLLHEEIYSVWPP